MYQTYRSSARLGPYMSAGLTRVGDWRDACWSRDGGGRWASGEDCSAGCCCGGRCGVGAGCTRCWVGGGALGAGGGGAGGFGISWAVTGGGGASSGGSSLSSVREGGGGGGGGGGVASACCCSTLGGSGWAASTVGVSGL